MPVFFSYTAFLKKFHVLALLLQLSAISDNLTYFLLITSIKAENRQASDIIAKNSETLDPWEYFQAWSVFLIF